LIAIFPYIIAFIEDAAGPDDDDNIAVAAKLLHLIYLQSEDSCLGRSF